MAKEDTLRNQVDAKPTRKVTVGSMGGAVATIAAFTLGHYGVEIPAGVEAAIATLTTSVLAYIVREYA